MKANFLLYLFFHKLNFPFQKTHETSLGILRVKPEVFHFFGRFFYLHYPTKLSLLHPNDDKIDSREDRTKLKELSKRVERKTSMKKKEKKIQTKSNIYWRHFLWCSLTAFEIEIFCFCFFLGGFHSLRQA